jgi:predicted nucleic acid-binding protein
MPCSYYIDACIWIDYFEMRNDKFRPLGEWAFKLIKKAVEDDMKIVLSDHLFLELRNRYSAETIRKIFEILPEQTILNITTNDRQANEAFKLKVKLNIPFGDALHAILARDNDAILVSRDKHYQELSEEVVIKKPEDLI